MDKQGEDEQIKPKRPRLIRTPAVPAIIDPLEFKPNLCTLSAREVITIDENVKITIWYDRHYVIREQLGEDNGEKREGIDWHLVEPIVKKGIKHLFFYSAIVKNFIFLNKKPKPENQTRGTRVVLMEGSDSQILNIAIEVNFSLLSQYEITVITAKRGDFKLGQGQYCVKLFEDGSELLKFEDGKLTKIMDI
jgi:hypothetical protein